jgi:hypothetical protein
MPGKSRARSPSSATQISGPHDALTRNKSSPTRRARAPPTGSGSALSSGPHGWGPAVPTEIWSPQLRPGSAHWARSSGRALPAVEVRQCPLRSGVRCWEERRKGRTEGGSNSNNTISRPSPGRQGKTQTPHKGAGTQNCDFHGFPTFSNIFPRFSHVWWMPYCHLGPPGSRARSTRWVAPRGASHGRAACWRGARLLQSVISSGKPKMVVHKCSQNIARSCQQKILGNSGLDDQISPDRMRWDFCHQQCFLTNYG